MRALVEGMVKWLATLPVKDDETRKQFEHGLYRMAERGESNPIFDVLCTASEQSVTRASELEKLRIEHEEVSTPSFFCFIVLFFGMLTASGNRS